jgi:hypothetical protein
MTGAVTPAEIGTAVQLRNLVRQSFRRGCRKCEWCDINDANVAISDGIIGIPVNSLKLALVTSGTD